MNKEFKIIVAYDKKRGIGSGSEIPWYIPEDLKRFKKLTLGQTVIMGRKTFESIIKKLGKPLPGRRNIILSKTIKETKYDNCLIFDDLNKIVDFADDAWIIGGEEIYRLFLPFADKIFATEIENEYYCDVFFPKTDESEWQIVETEKREGYTFVTLRRISPT